jgi:hypothetical protein
MLKISSVTLPKEHELKRKQVDATTDTSCRPITERDHSQGPSTAAITPVPYGDYECPYTRQSTTVVRAIQRQLGEQLRFVFCNFPLTEIHPHALTLVITGLLSGGCGCGPVPAGGCWPTISIGQPFASAKSAPFWLRPCLCFPLRWPSGILRWLASCGISSPWLLSSLSCSREGGPQRQHKGVAGV